MLARRGHEVKIADAAHSPGGRLQWETKLPGLSEWARVRAHSDRPGRLLSDCTRPPGESPASASIT